MTTCAAKDTVYTFLLKWNESEHGRWELKRMIWAMKILISREQDKVEERNRISVVFSRLLQVIAYFWTLFLGVLYRCLLSESSHKTKVIFSFYLSFIGYIDFSRCGISLYIACYAWVIAHPRSFNRFIFHCKPTYLNAFIDDADSKLSH